MSDYGTEPAQCPICKSDVDHCFCDTQEFWQLIEELQLRMEMADHTSMTDQERIEELKEANDALGGLIVDKVERIEGLEAQVKSIADDYLELKRLRKGEALHHLGETKRIAELKSLLNYRDEVIDRKNDTIEELEAKQEWQPIETAPKDGTWILLYCSQQKVAISGMWHVEPDLFTPDVHEPGWSDWVSDNDYIMWDSGYSPTHWMPLPEPPMRNEE
jgi:hypothetical protein